MRTVRVPWHDHDAALAALLEAADRAARQSPSWRLAWCAGAGVVATPVEALLAETALFRAFVAGLARRPRGVLPVVLRGRRLRGVVRRTARSPRSPRRWRWRRTAPPSSTWRTPSGRLADRGARVVIGRIANLYGPGQDLSKPQGLVSQLCLTHLTGQALSIYVLARHAARLPLRRRRRGHGRRLARPGRGGASRCHGDQDPRLGAGGLGRRAHRRVEPRVPAPAPARDEDREHPAGPGPPAAVGGLAGARRPGPDVPARRPAGHGRRHRLPAARGTAAEGDGVTSRRRELGWLLIACVAVWVAWTYPLLHDSRHYFRGDTQNAYYGWFHHFGDALLHGHWPMLDAQAGSAGNPLAEGQMGLYSPLSAVDRDRRRRRPAGHRLRHPAQVLHRHDRGERVLPARPLVRRASVPRRGGSRRGAARRLHAGQRRTPLGDRPARGGPAAMGLVGDPAGHGRSPSRGGTRRLLAAGLDGLRLRGDVPHPRHGRAVPREPAGPGHEGAASAPAGGSVQRAPDRHGLPAGHPHVTRDLAQPLEHRGIGAPPDGPPRQPS